MNVFLASLLIVNAVWNVMVWPRFYARVNTDPRARDAEGRATRFLRVHAVLVGVSLLLALASFVAGVIGVVNG